MKTKTGIGALVITRNEEKHLKGCLESLAFCDERVVVDSFSTDRTVEIACEAAEHVYRRPFVHHADQKNWGLERLRTEWVLILDADERVGPELADEVVRLAAEETERGGFWIRRRNRFFGRAIRGAGWDRDRVLRFFRRDLGRYESRYLHEEVRLVDGVEAGECSARLDHYSYVDWPSTFERWLAYSARGARDRKERGRRGSARSVLLRPWTRFVQQYIGRRGLRDGVHGFVLCTWSALGILLRELKLALGQDAVDVRRPARVPAGGVEVVQGRPVESTGNDGGPRAGDGEGVER